MSSPSDLPGIVVAAGNLSRMRELERLLRADGVAAEVVRPPGGSGKG